MSKLVLKEKATWSDRVSQYSKSIVATLTPAVALGASLGATLPADLSIPITAGVAIGTGILTWIASNTVLLSSLAEAAEELGESITGRDL